MALMGQSGGTASGCQRLSACEREIRKDTTVVLTAASAKPVVSLSMREATGGS